MDVVHQVSPGHQAYYLASLHDRYLADPVYGKKLERLGQTISR